MMTAGANWFNTGLAFVLLAVALTAPLGHRDHMADLAAILLATTIFWTYVEFCQFLIIWEENIRSEIPWYLERLRDGWRSVMLSLAWAQFIVPFFLLVSTPAKRSRVVVGAACVLALVAHWLEAWWLVLPPFHNRGFSWIDPLVGLGMAGLWCGVFLWRLRHGRLLPAGEARSLEQRIHG